MREGAGGQLLVHLLMCRTNLLEADDIRLNLAEPVEASTASGRTNPIDVGRVGYDAIAF